MPGIVKAVGAGSTIIDVAYAGLTQPLTINVTTRAVASINISPATFSGVVGDTQQLNATCLDAHSNPMYGQTITWDTDNHAIATVDSNGLVTCVAAGTCHVTASVGAVSGSSTATIATTLTSDFPVIATIDWNPEGLIHGTGKLSDGANVTSFTDLLAGKILTNPGVAPTISLNALNGMPVILFNGSSQYLSIADISGVLNGTAVSIFAVFNMTSIPGSARYAVSTISGNYGWGIFNYPASAQMRFQEGNGTTTSAGANNITVGAHHIYTAAKQADGYWHWRVDANTGGDAASANPLAYPTPTPYPLTVGANVAGSNFMPMQLARLVIYNGNWTAANVNSIYTWAHTKYGI